MPGSADSIVVTVPHLEDCPVTQAELSHLETRRPDDGHSGYRNVRQKECVRIADGRGRPYGPRDRWRVLVTINKEVWQISGTFCSPREAAKALVWLYRDYFGPDWMTRVPSKVADLSRR